MTADETLLQAAAVLGEEGVETSLAEGVLVVSLASFAEGGEGAVALFCRQPGWLTAVVQLVDEDSDALTAGLLQNMLSLSEVSGLVRVVRTEAGVWLRGDVPSPGQARLLVEHLSRAGRGLVEGDLRAAFAVRGPGPAPDAAAVLAALQATRFEVLPAPDVSGWQIREPMRPGGRPLLARWISSGEALLLMVGLHEAPDAVLPDHFVETLMQINDQMQASRFVLVEGLGLMIQSVVPLPCPPALLEIWIAQVFSDSQQAVSALVPPQADLASRIRLLRAWLVARVEAGEVSEVVVARSLRAAVRGEALPADGPQEAMFGQVIGEVARVLFEELPAREPRAHLLMGMGVENAVRGRPLDELWEVALSYLGASL